tara:strand:+ start:228 stop:680 length:453 start_codon:yes stop_codon:yes gene_type:complete
MKKVSLDVLIQLLGMVGVLGGLIFVGLEMQLSQRIALAGQVQARAQMNIERLLSPMEGNLDALRLWSPEGFSYELLNEDEKLIAVAIHQWRFNMLENNFTQYQMGLFAEDYWNEAQERIELFYNACDLRFGVGKRVQSFQEYLDTIPDRC